MSWGKELGLLWARLVDHQPTTSNNPSGWVVLKKQTKIKVQGHKLHNNQGLLGCARQLKKVPHTLYTDTCAQYTNCTHIQNTFLNYYNNHFVCKAHLVISHANTVRDSYHRSHSCKLSYLL